MPGVLEARQAGADLPQRAVPLLLRVLAAVEGRLPEATLKLRGQGKRTTTRAIEAELEEELIPAGPADLAAARPGYSSPRG